MERGRPARPRFWIRRGVAFVLAALTIGLAAGVYAAFQDGAPRAFVYRWKIRKALRASAGQPDYEASRMSWQVIEGSLNALAGLERDAGRRALERYSRDTRLTKRLRKRTLQLLYRHYPDSLLARGSREYEEIIGGSYFWGNLEWSQRWIHDLAVGPAQASRLRLWLRRYPGHPGQDDALMRLAAVELGAKRPYSALGLLHEAIHAPDGRCRLRVTTNIRYALDRYCDAGGLERWLEAECPEHLRPLVLYCAAVHRLRERRYELAIRHFERFLRTEGPARDEIATWRVAGEIWRYVDQPPERAWCIGPPRLPESVETVWAEVRTQLEHARWLATSAARFEAMKTDPAAAAVLHAMGRRCFHQPGLFRNIFVSPQPFSTGDLPKLAPLEECLDALQLDSGYRQAAYYFRRIARDYPGYEHLEPVEYSIPLCLWRMKASRKTGTTPFDYGIAEGFQRFADKYPKSALADEALYSAGVHFLWSAGDKERMRADMRRIATEHPDGNIAREYRARNAYLRKALAEARAGVQDDRGAEREAAAGFPE